MNTVLLHDGRVVSAADTRGCEQELVLRYEETGKLAFKVDAILGLLNVLCIGLPIRFEGEFLRAQIEIVVEVCATRGEVVMWYVHALAILESVIAPMGIVANAEQYITDVPKGNLLEQGCIFPNDYYRNVFERLGPERAREAAAVAAGQLNLGCFEGEQMRIRGNALGAKLDRLIALGDHSQGRRIAAHRKTIGYDGVPPRYTSVAAWEADAENRGFRQDRRKCHDLIRWRDGYLELRMLGAARCPNELLRYFDVAEAIINEADETTCTASSLSHPQACTH